MNENELKALQDRYIKALDEAQRLRQKYDGKPETMSGEEIKTWTGWMDEADKLQSMIEVARREQKSRAWAEGTADALKMISSKPGASDSGDETKAARATAWKAYFRGTTTNDAEAKAIKALAAQEGDLGGFLVMPQELVERLVVMVKDILFVRQYATVYPLEKAESLGVPTLDNDLGDPTWTSELSFGNEDAVAPFGKRQLNPHPVARYVKISNKLLRQATIDPEAIVMDRLAYRLARVMENAYLNGTGQDQPLGIFVASANGIDSTRDTASATAGTLGADDLISVKHQLKPQYWAKARWTMHRNVLATIRKLKDTSGQYVWQPGIGTTVATGTSLVGGNPDTILGLPYDVSELAPSTVAAGNYVASLGDWSTYWIADALNTQIQRLIELFALSNQTAFTIRAESDGMPVLNEAFVRLKV